jgi:ADP-ribose pyrophosphatase YjhB (NUDIX family)
MIEDHVDRVRELFRAFNSADAATLESFYAPDAFTDGVFLAPERSATPLRGREAVGAALREYLQKFAPALEGRSYVRIRALARLETARGWVHAEWVAGVHDREQDATHHLTGYTHFYVGSAGTIEQQRSVVQPAGADAAADVPAPPPLPRGSRRYPSRPIVGVGAVIFVEERVVLIKRRYEPLAGQWSLPGGTLEVGETLEAGIAREVLEETGLVVEVGPVVEVFDRILLDENRQVVYHFVLIDYLCRPLGGELQHGSDVADVTLAHPDALVQYGVTPKATAIIRRAAEVMRREPWPEPPEPLL